MTRRMLNLLTALSLLVCAAVCALWVRSYYVSDSVTWNVWRGSSFAVSVQVFSGSGQIGLGYLEARTAAVAGSVLFGGGPRLKWERSETVAGGFYVTHLWAFHSLSTGGSVRQTLGQTPYWFPAAVAAGLAVVARRMSRRVRRPGICPSCGYDLRSTPNRCPECGTTGDLPVGR